MSTNRRRSLAEVAKLAAATLRDARASQTAKRLAGSAIAQTNSDKQTGAEVEDLASRVMRGAKYNEDTKALAASVLSQSNKER